MTAKNTVRTSGETGASGLAFCYIAQREGPPRAREKGVLDAGRTTLV